MNDVGTAMLIRGTFVTLPSLAALHILTDYLLGVDETGHITHFSAANSPTSKALLTSTAVPPIQIPQGSFLLPPFCDLHLHAPQFLYQGTGLHLSLMQWLDEYAFKAEERLDADPALARRVYTRLAQRLIENGTGTVLLFGTIKEGTNLILADTMQRAGVRALVGKLSMDISSRPSYVEASAEAALSAARSFVSRCKETVAALPAHSRLVAPVLTPRFVPTCSNELLEGLGRLAAEQSLRVQSHMAEAHDQVEWVRSERGAEDIDVFDQRGLLTPDTIQAHCTFLDAAALARVADRGTAIAHCPLSNAYFSAAPFALREVLAAGVRVGLGTDVAGGYSLDMMSAMRHAVTVSRMREGKRRLEHAGENEAAESVAIDWKEALYLATQGGKEALGLGRGSGSFEVGAPFDAQQIQIFDAEKGAGIGALDFFDLELGESPDVSIEMVEKWWCIGDGRNRVGLWVQGNRLELSVLVGHE
ncbi:putative amidohydrolase family protein [Lyophyllum shimeji]|uniref:Amidohydrolase family protein n=1 Tax=Lyophyllum shimeji TaxID=47721 RepID=A0A9P3Q2J2_LYOSH|nr:putative amidohydrolase family protein [Lyophyllum shimeji]